MAEATIRGVPIRYEVFGTKGSWISLSPGGRRGHEELRALAELLAAKGRRVLLHDRRNCGASGIAIEPAAAEDDQWADDLHALLGELGALPASVGGGSSGSRLALVFALRHPEAVSALLMMRVTGGPFAANRLSEVYYDDYVAAAKKGGMAAVAETPFFAERIAARPDNRDRVAAMDPEHFAAIMSGWKKNVAASGGLPVLGATEAQLRSLRCPVYVIPGNDRIHWRQAGLRLHELLSDSELFDLVPNDAGQDVGPIEEWMAIYPEITDSFDDFLNRRGI